MTAAWQPHRHADARIEHTHASPHSDAALQIDPLVAVVPHDARPQWVTDAIRELTAITEGIVSAQDKVQKLALQLAPYATVLTTSDLTEAHHDLDHAFSHITSVRRGLRMSWPNEPGDRT